MIIVRSPFRVSFFGGSTDYESFYKENGSFLIGTTIDKYAYLCMKKRSPILPDENILIYSKLEKPKRIEDIQQPLIRNVLQFYKVKDYIEFTSFFDCWTFRPVAGYFHPARRRKWPQRICCRRLRPARIPIPPRIRAWRRADRRCAAPA